MAITGATAAIVRAGARKLGVSYEDLAEYSNLSLATAFAVADAVTALQGDATWSGFTGTNVRIEWGDGDVEYVTNDGSASHAYPANGTYTARISGLGETMEDSVTIS